jgi:adenosylmethionine-8-amino-7-oxononanoate aminotransferase
MSLGKSSGFFQAFRELLFEIHSVPVPHTWLGHRATEEEDRILEETQKLLNESGSQISALFVEPLVQGAAGMRFHSVRFLEQLCALVRQHGILIVFDEVMTAFHRLGSLFAFQQTDIIPDILCLSKGITGGILPLGATIAQNRIFDAFLAEGFERALAHGHSFTGNPICCAAALANLTLLDAEDLPARLDALHRSLQSNLQSLLNHPLTSRHRCLGTVAAFDLRDGSAQYGNFAGRPLARFAREAGVLLRPIGNAVYVLPPYCTTASQIDAAFDVVRAWLQKP